MKESKSQTSRPYLAFFLLIALCFGLAHFSNLPSPSQFREEEIAESPQEAIEPVNVFDEGVPSFSSISSVAERKATFFNFLLPLVDSVNGEVLDQRKDLLDLYAKQQTGTALSGEELEFLDDLSTLYKVRTVRSYSENHFRQLLLRIDIIPISLVLAQAANESAWGTSRFANEGKNFFGQWCYTTGCGIVPSRRPEGELYEVKAFNLVEESVRAYVLNLNTHLSYRHLWSIRSDQRLSGQVIDGISLSSGLESYSQRGQLYIDELQSMIYSNDLHELDFMRTRHYSGQSIQ